MDKFVGYSLRVDNTLLQKFRYISKLEGRSANKEIEQFMKRRVASFEQEHGEIPSEFES